MTRGKVLQYIKKHVWPLFINMLPFALHIAMYSFGAPLEILMFPPVFAVLTFMNYNSFEKTLHYVMIQSYLLVCMFCSGCISTYLYYHNISGDNMTPAIGLLMILLGSVIVVITTVITSLVKIINNKKQIDNEV